MGMETLLPKLDASGIDLLSRMLAYIPEEQIFAQEALHRAFFVQLIIRSISL